ncbi:MAG: GGDEF domain-containing protein [Chloroflexota bacterium]
MHTPLRKFSLFRSLPDADLHRLSACFSRREVASGQIIFNMGDPGSEVCFVESGRVTVFDPAAPGVPVRVFDEGSLFGELAVIDHKPRTLSARAELDTRLWTLPAADFERLILDNRTLLLNILVGLSASIRYTTDIFRQAAQRSIIDSLTGIYNRNLFDSLVSVLQEDPPCDLSVIVVDIDGLKRTNDSLGHAAGDRLIQNTAAILRAAVRAEDCVARIGGDEFAILLPRVNRTGADEMARRVFAGLDEHNRRCPDEPVSFSLGLASGSATDSQTGALMIEALISQADAVMYAHKQSRRAGRPAGA